MSQNNKIKELITEVKGELELIDLIEKTRKEIEFLKEKTTEYKKKYTIAKNRLRHLKARLKLKSYYFKLDDELMFNTDKLKNNPDYIEMKNLWKGL